MKQIILVACLLFSATCSNNLLAQTAEIDSLVLHISEHPKRDSGMVNKLIAIASAYQHIEPQKALKYTEEAGSLAYQINYQRGIADYFCQLARYNYVASDFEKVLHYSNKSLEINRQIANYTGAAENLRMIGNIQYFKGNVSEALKNLHESLDLYTQLNDSIGISSAYASLATDYADIGKTDTALSYANKALEIAELKNDDRTISLALNNLGVILYNEGNVTRALECYQNSLIIDERLKDYRGASIIASNIAYILKVKGNYHNALEFSRKGIDCANKIDFKTGLTYNYENMAHIYKEQREYKMAWEYQQKTLALQKEIGNQQGVVNAYNDLAEIRLLQDSLSEAMVYLEKALTLSKTISYKSVEVTSYIGISEVFYRQGQLHKAYEYSTKGFEMATELSNPELIAKSSEALAKTAEGLGLFEEAYRAQVIFKTMSDSLYNETNIKRIADLEFQYKFEKEKELLQIEQQKKDKIQEAELKKQHILIRSLVVVFVLMSLLILAVLRSISVKRKANELLKSKNTEIKAQSDKLKSTNQSLIKLSDYKENMINMVIHDLKNPLAVLLNIDIVDDEQERNDLIKAASVKMMTMVQNILDVYKYEKTELKLSKKKVDIYNLLEVSTEELSVLAGLSQLTFAIEKNNAILVNADALIVSRILDNILSNAIKFAKQDSTISVSAQHIENNYVKISIHNTGKYIPKSQQSIIFERFGQAEDKDFGNIRSTGIGLTYCKIAVEAHGGNIGVESDEERGNTFWFTLPQAI